MGQRVVSWHHATHNNDSDDFMSQLCSKTVRATFMAHGSSVMRPLSSGICPAVKYSREDLRSDASCLPLAGHRSLTPKRGF